MDYNTLKNIVYNMPETYEEVTKANPAMASIIQQEVLLDNLIKHGIFKDRDDYFNLCQKRYEEIREETIKELEKMEEENEK